MNDFDASKKKQKLTVHDMMKKAEQTKGGKGGLRSVVGYNSKTERHGPHKGETVVRICVLVMWLRCVSGMKHAQFCILLLPRNSSIAFDPDRTQ